MAAAQGARRRQAYFRLSTTSDAARRPLPLQPYGLRVTVAPAT